MNGKGQGPRKGYNWAKYAENYDAIFRPNQRKEPMKTPEQEQPEQPTVLPWHREAAKEIDDNPFTQEAAELAAIIARHDPHAATLRLLEELDAEIQGAMNNAFPEDAPDILDGIGAKIRAHLATHSKPDEMQQSAKQEGRQ